MKYIKQTKTNLLSYTKKVSKRCNFVLCPSRSYYSAPNNPKKIIYSLITTSLTLQYVLQAWWRGTSWPAGCPPRGHPPASSSSSSSRPYLTLPTKHFSPPTSNHLLAYTVDSSILILPGFYSKRPLWGA